ncbi:guanine nucleotide-binding protein subunit beta-like protein [Cladorrhinum samala]|uniref:Guanine nucleotide-binding protein subunit beta-like protein n=1 Tax=Cladorrhinum samala TaxID=585594 RepID=A0AAV9HQ68_9PEZI|nr:guanine nucleotide-binding protein subunit beta-like protein [Cladorrhinum samala]
MYRVALLESEVSSLRDSSLSVPDSSDRRSIVSSSSSARRWDDPPEEPPPPNHPTTVPAPQAGGSEVGNLTTMVFVKSVTARRSYVAEVAALQFTPNDTHLAAMFPRTVNVRTFFPDEPATLVLVNVRDGSRLPTSLVSSHDVKVSGGFAFRPRGADLVVACPYFVPGESLSSSSSASSGFGRVPRIEVYDCGRSVRWSKQEVPMRAPVAFSPDGMTLAGVSTRDPSRIVLARFSKEMVAVRTMVIKHTDEVTRLAYLPDGTKLVSAGRDGYLRLTCLESGRTLKRIEVMGRAHASILEVARDGTRVVSVWGRDVVVWDLGSGGVHTYNLDVIRGDGMSEGWPLAVSPDCRYLACRTEDGFDVSDVDTGKFRGDFATRGSVITSAAFTKNGSKIAVGNYDGLIEIYDVITV